MAESRDHGEVHPEPTNLSTPPPLVDVVAEPPETVTSLGDSANQGVRWGFIATMAMQLGRLGTSFVLARLLGPDDFGIVALAYVYLALVSVLIDQAFGVLVVQRPTLTREELGTATVINTGMVVLLTLVTILVAPLVSSFFHEPELTSVLRALSLSVVFGGLAAIPLGLLARALRFVDIAKVQLVATAIASTAAIAAAFAGAGIWALVVQGVCAPLVLLVGGLILAGRPVMVRRLVAVRSMLSFSGPLVIAQVLGFVGLYADNLLIGRFKGAVQLGYYALAYRIMLAVMDVVTGVIQRVSLPLYSRAADDVARLNRGFLVAVRAATLASYGVLVLAILGAPTAIPIVFGHAWDAAIVPLQFLMAASLARVVMWMLAPLATARARTDLVLIWSIIVIGADVVAFVIGLRWGIDGVAAGFCVASFLLVLPNTSYVGRVMGLDLRQFLRAVLPAMAAAIAMAMAWFGIEAGLAALGVDDLPAALVAGLGGCVAYGATVRFAFPTDFREVWALAAGVIGRGAALPPA